MMARLSSAWKVLSLEMAGDRRLTLPASVLAALAKEREHYVVLYRGRDQIVVLSLPSEFREVLNGLLRQGKRNIGLVRMLAARAIQRFPDSRGRIAMHPSLWNRGRRPKRMSLCITGRQ